MAGRRGLTGIEEELASAIGSRRLWLQAELAWVLRMEEPLRSAALAAELLESQRQAESSLVGERLDRIHGDSAPEVPGGDREDAGDQSMQRAVGRAHCCLAFEATGRGDSEAAESHALAAFDCPGARLDPITRGASAALLAGNLHLRGRQEEAKELLKSTLAGLAADDPSTRVARIAVLNELGRCSFVLCDWTSAHEHFARALALAQREGETRMEGVLNVNLGNVLSELGESEGCLEHYREALHIHRMRADVAGQSLALHDLAVVHARIGDHAEAERCAREAMGFTQRSGARSSAWTALLLADQLLERGELAEARELSRSTLAEARTAGNPPAVAQALCSLARVERHADSIEEAAALLAEALLELERVDDLGPKLDVRVELSLLHEAAGRPEEAAATAHHAAEGAREVGSTTRLISALEVLERARLSCGDPAGALEALRERHAAEIGELRRAAEGRSEVLRARHELDRALQREKELEARHGELEAEVAIRTEALRRSNDELQEVLRAKQQGEREREQLSDQLRQSQKMEAVGRLAGGVAHDFNNLLTVLRGNAELLAGVLQDRSDAKELAQSQLDACDRAARLTSQLLAFSRHRPRESQALDANALLGNLEVLLQRLIGEDIVLEFQLTKDPVWIEADPGSLEQVLVNLAVNARDAMPSGGSLSVSTHRREFDSHTQARAEHVIIAVSDTGSGIAPELLELIFEPFFTTKPVGEGTGLGLTTSYGLVRQAGGTILVSSTPGTGSTFEVLFPAIEAREPAVRVLQAPPSRAEGLSRHVLLVEDEPAVRSLLKRGLEDLGHRVSCAGDGVEALELVEGAATSFDVVVSDVVMPRMGGPELLARLLERGECPPFVLTSGWPDRAAAPPDGRVVQHVFLEKPFRLAELSAAIDSLCP